MLPRSEYEPWPPKRGSDKGLEQLKSFLDMLPVRMLSLNLGIAGMGVLWSTARDYLVYEPEVWSGEWIPVWIAFANFVCVSSCCVCIGILSLFIIKMMLDWDGIRRDAQNAEYAPVFCMGSIAVFLISSQIGYFFSRDVAEFMWCLALAVHVLLITNWGWQLAKWDITVIGPSYFVPPVGIAFAASVCHNVNTCESSTGIFYFAVCAYIIMLPLCFYRAHFVNPPLTDVQENLYIVFADPPALLLCVWIQTQGGSVFDPWTHILFALMCIFLVATAIRFYMKQTLCKPFLPSQAAWVFCTAIVSKAFILYFSLVAEYQDAHFHFTECVILWLLVLSASTLCGLVIYRYWHAISSGMVFADGE